MYYYDRLKGYEIYYNLALVVGPKTKLQGFCTESPVHLCLTGLY